jgi:hypothetical protein
MGGCGKAWAKFFRPNNCLILLEKAMKEINEGEWNEACVVSWGRVLNGEKAHLCADLDDTPVDETCSAFEMCQCFSNLDADELADRRYPRPERPPRCIINDPRQGGIITLEAMVELLAQILKREPESAKLPVFISELREGERYDNASASMLHGITWPIKMKMDDSPDVDILIIAGTNFKQE